MKLTEYLEEGIFDKKMASMKADLDKKYGSASGKTIDNIYKHLMMVPEFKKLGMDRQGEISMKVLSMIQGKK
jgi:hypothetical protein